MNQEVEKILVTGATGFVGSRFLSVATEKGFSVRPAFRNGERRDDGVVVGEIGPETDWRAALDGISAVVHLAAKVHFMDEAAQNPLAGFRRVNVEGTANLARQAVEAGVRRFVFISSAKVAGEATLPGRPFRPTDPSAPADSYTISKHEAEGALKRLAAETNMEVVIIRPPLVYGPGVRANFLRLMGAIHQRLPLPLGRVRNLRSMVALDNLVDLIMTCIDHPNATGETFLVSDGEDISTPELIRRMGRAMGKKDRLFPVPPPLLRMAGKMLGKGPEMDRLLNSLQVDISHTCKTLCWRPPISVDEGLKETAEWYMHGC